MNQPFDQIWQTILHHLTPGTTIKNWTIQKGYLGDMMKVVQVNEDEIIIRAPNAKNLQRVSRDEFEKIYGIWPAYQAGRMQRQEIRGMTYYSKYILSILHWLEADKK